MKTITVEVTQDDIKKGRRGQCNRRPVALALTRAIGEPCRVGLLTLGPMGGRYMIRHPVTVAEFIFDFDRLFDVEPFTFTIEAPV